MKKILLLAIVNCSLSIFNSHAQSIIVSFADGSSESHLLSSVKTITYTGDVMNLNLTGGSTLSWNASTVKNIEYDIVTNAQPATFNSSLSTKVYPNPSQEQVTIEYTLPAAAEVSIQLLDMQGRTVKQSTREQQAAGKHSLTWDLNKSTTPGNYLCRITMGKQTTVKQLIINN